VNQVHHQKVAEVECQKWVVPQKVVVKPHQKRVVKLLHKAVLRVVHKRPLKRPLNLLLQKHRVVENLSSNIKKSFHLKGLFFWNYFF
jgi:hypothetical protein